MNITDSAVRIRAFEWLKEQVGIHGEVLPRALLAEGFTFFGERVPLVAPNGIFTPRIAQYPLSITTVPNSPYADSYSPDGLLSYKYRGTDPHHRDNVGLREALRRGLPLIYLFGVIPGQYLPVWPVYVVRDQPDQLAFTVAFDDAATAEETAAGVEVGSFEMPRRAYITTVVRRRLHQTSFRAMVLRAYGEQCSLCRLRRAPLLDAAHIIEDAHLDGVPSVNNGIALCKLHHAAFDSMIVGINPDYRVELRQDVLEEIDGPMLEHGLKGLHGSRIMLPRQSVAMPNQEALRYRYELFRKAS
jgi:putative restriction endonuclease